MARCWPTPCGWSTTTPPATNLIMDSFTANAHGQLAVTYTIVGQNAPPFSIGIYQSADGVQPTNLVGTINVSDSSDLTGGGGAVHTLTYDGDLNGLDGGQYYLARLDAYDEVAETTKTDNLSAPLTGLFQDSDGSVYALTGLDSSGHNVAFVQNPTSGDLTVNLDGSVQTFQGVGTIYMVAYHGANTIDAAGVDLPMTVYGGDGHDTIIGGDGGNTIYGGTAGGNVIYAGAGDDTIYGRGGTGGGHNRIYGGAGSDTIYAGDGGDTITGGTGNDTIYAGAGNDNITGGTGNNEIYGGAGLERPRRPTRPGQLDSGRQRRRRDLRRQRQRLALRRRQQRSTTTIYGGSGNEVIHGGAGDNILYGGSGQDEIYGGTGPNWMYGKGAHDVFQGGSGGSDENYIDPRGGGGLASIEVKNDENQTYFRRHDGCERQPLSGRLPGRGPRLSGRRQRGRRLCGCGGLDFLRCGLGGPSGRGRGHPAGGLCELAAGRQLRAGTQWAEHAVSMPYRPGGTRPLGEQTVNQQQSPGYASPEGSDRPWRLLGVWNVPAGDTLEVELSGRSSTVWATCSAAGRRDDPSPLADGDIAARPGVTVNPLVPDNPIAQGDYVDWVDACNPINIPVEGQGDRVTEFNSMRRSTPFSCRPPVWEGLAWNWTADMPAISGVDYGATPRAIRLGRARRSSRAAPTRALFGSRRTPVRHHQVRSRSILKPTAPPGRGTRMPRRRWRRSQPRRLQMFSW